MYKSRSCPTGPSGPNGFALTKAYTYFSFNAQLQIQIYIFFPVLDSKLALNFQPNGFPPVTVRPSEVAIVGIVLCVWASAVYVFFTQWGK